MTTRVDQASRHEQASRQHESVASRSGAAAAVLSFIFPGLGQGYLRDRRAAIAFGLPVVLGIVLLVFAALSAGGVSRLAFRLLDPTVATAALMVVIALGLWRAAAVIHAWRGGSRTGTGLVVMAGLLVLVGLMHAYVADGALRILAADNQIFGGDPFADGPLPVAQATATPTPALPTEPGATAPPRTQPPADYEDPDDAPPSDEPEPTIEPGPTPGVDIAAIDASRDGLVNVAIIGTDWKPGRTHKLTDTMIVVSANSETGEVLMFSFPRDIARFPLYNGGTYNGRLNTFANYAQRSPDAFPEGGMKALSYQLGFLLGIPVDYYASVNMIGFMEVVRAVGGVTIDNKFALADDKMQFYLPVGEHRLSPDDALRFARSRHGPHSSDFARAQRQQQLLAALRKEMLRPQHLANLPQIVEALSRVVHTDFPPAQIADLVDLAGSVEDDPSASWVFKNPEWAVHPPAGETGGRSLIFLKLDKIADLSRELFGQKSLYSR